MVKSAVMTTLQGFFGANALAGLFGSYVLQFLWGLINTLQMIVVTAIFNLDWTPNVNDVMLTIFKLVAFELVDTESILDLMFDVRSTRPFLTKEDDSNTRFADAGYESSNFIYLIGPLFIAILAWLAYVVFILFSRLLSKPCKENCFTRRVRRSIQSKIVIIRFLLEGCIEIGISAVIQIITTEEEIFDDNDEVFAYVLAIMALTSLFFAPIIFWRMTSLYLF